MGAAGRAARGGAQHLPADAAARPQHRRLHAVPGVGHAGVRRRRRPRPGIDIYRIFDALNNVESMRPAIDAVRETGTAIAEVAMSYTGDLSDPGENLYTLDYYLKLAEQIVDAGAHVLAIKDMAGLLRPPAATTLVGALRSRFDLPVHVHTHDTPGGQLATYLAAWQAGARRRRRRVGADGGHHQPARAVARSSPRPRTPSTTPGCRCRRCATSSRTGRRCERCTRRSNPGCPRPTGRVYTTRFPAASCRTCASRPSRWGWGTGSRRSRTTYAAADRVLGRLVKVTPSSKVVGDLALALVGAGRHRRRIRRRPRRDSTFPDSVIGFLRGELGDPPGGWPEPLRTKALAGRAPAKPQPGADRRGRGGARAGRARSARPTLNRLLFPGPTKEFEAHREHYGDTSQLVGQPVLLRAAPAARSTGCNSSAVSSC